MAHIMKLSEFQSATGAYYIADIEELGKGSNDWHLLYMCLDISAEELITQLKNKYKASNCSYSADKDVLVFSFDSLANARVFKNAFNKIARDRKFTIC